MSSASPSGPSSSSSIFQTTAPVPPRTAATLVAPRLPSASAAPFVQDPVSIAPVAAGVPRPQGQIIGMHSSLTPQPVKRFFKPTKSCNCKNSRCLKLYCECFANNIYCTGCNCRNCYNTKDQERLRKNAIEATLERNPRAFRPKIAQSPIPTVAKTPTSTVTTVRQVHHKGCHCKKSHCLKKYCECYQAGILCSANCKCNDCKNYEGSEERNHMDIRKDVRDILFPPLRQSVFPPPVSQVVASTAPAPVMPGGAIAWPYNSTPVGGSYSAPATPVRSVMQPRPHATNTPTASFDSLSHAVPHQVDMSPLRSHQEFVASSPSYALLHSKPFQSAVVPLKAEPVSTATSNSSQRRRANLFDGDAIETLAGFLVEAALAEEAVANQNAAQDLLGLAAPRLAKDEVTPISSSSSSGASATLLASSTSAAIATAPSSRSNSATKSKSPARKRKKRRKYLVISRKHRKKNAAGPSGSQKAEASDEYDDQDEFEDDEDGAMEEDEDLTAQEAIAAIEHDTSPTTAARLASESLSALSDAAAAVPFSSSSAPSTLQPPSAPLLSNLAPPPRSSPSPLPSIPLAVSASAPTAQSSPAAVSPIPPSSAAEIALNQMSKPLQGYVGAGSFSFASPAAGRRNQPTPPTIKEDFLCEEDDGAGDDLRADEDAPIPPATSSVGVTSSRGSGSARRRRATRETHTQLFLDQEKAVLREFASFLSKSIALAQRPATSSRGDSSLARGALSTIPEDEQLEDYDDVDEDYDDEDEDDEDEDADEDASG